MTDIARVLQSIVAFYQASIGYGHTRAAMKGVLHTPNARIVTHTREFGMLLRRDYGPEVNFVRYDDFAFPHDRGPVVFDNAALVHIFTQAWEELQAYRDLSQAFQHATEAIKHLQSANKRRDAMAERRLADMDALAWESTLPDGPGSGAFLYDGQHSTWRQLDDYMAGEYTNERSGA